MIEIPHWDPLGLKLNFLSNHTTNKKKNSRPKQKVQLDKIQHYLANGTDVILIRQLILRMLTKVNSMPLSFPLSRPNAQTHTGSLRTKTKGPSRPNSTLRS